MPTGSDFSRVDFSNSGNTADYKDRQSEGRTGEFTQVRPDSDIPAGTRENDPAYPNVFPYGYDASNREFSRDKNWEPQAMAEEASGSAFADLQRFLNTSPYTAGSRVCHEEKETWTSPHDAAPGGGTGKTGPA